MDLVSEEKQAIVRLVLQAVQQDMRLAALEKRVTVLEDRDVDNKQEYARLVKKRGETPQKE